MTKIICLLLCNLVLTCSFGQPINKAATKKMNSVLPGCYRTASYLPLLHNKRVAVFANNTSTFGTVHLIDSLLSLHINVVKIFGPEHGFRGVAGAGDKVDSYKDSATGIPIISLYGKKLKPSKDDLSDVDVMMFDIQDVGVRFYTYISSLQYYIESAIENGKPIIILDRPNPNGFYIDGPVLDTAFRSFIGMQPIPVVYGMTMGEYTQFIIGERLLYKEAMKIINAKTQKAKCTNIKSVLSAANIYIIKCINYTHKAKYNLPQKPSPNLPDANAIEWYPTTCFFEGTVLSEGRGTEKPFRIFGHPSLPNHLFSFTPKSTPAAKAPKLMNQLCYGWDVSTLPGVDYSLPMLQLKYLINAYQMFPQKDSFFLMPANKKTVAKDIFFNKLVGNAILMEQIKQGKSEAEIRASWQPKLAAFKQTRKKYLLYAD